MGPDPIRRPRPRPACFFILTLLLLAAPTPSESFFFLFTSYQTLFSLSHSLMTRVANLRTSRGDAAGASRARLLAEKLEAGRNLGLIGLARSIVFQNVWNLASFRTLSDVNELMRCVSELTRLDSDEDRTAWARRNYGNTLTVLKSRLSKLLEVLAKPGPFKEVVVIMQRELVEGELIKDCFVVGSNDMKGISEIIKNIIPQFSSFLSTTNTNNDL